MGEIWRAVEWRLHDRAEWRRVALVADSWDVAVAKE